MCDLFPLPLENLPLGEYDPIFFNLFFDAFNDLLAFECMAGIDSDIPTPFESAASTCDGIEPTLLFTYDSNALSSVM
jgi:hypothetical protein